MTIVLECNQVCPFRLKCKYNDGSCFGARTDRKNKFTCEFVNSKGVFINDGYVRSNLDLTGKMKVIMEA